VPTQLTSLLPRVKSHSLSGEKLRMERGKKIFRYGIDPDALRSILAKWTHIYCQNPRGQLAVLDPGSRHARTQEGMVVTRLHPRWLCVHFTGPFVSGCRSVCTIQVLPSSQMSFCGITPAIRCSRCCCQQCSRSLPVLPGRCARCPTHSPGPAHTLF